MNTDLTGKTALVCGSSQGIGLACATELASLGAVVTLVARNAETLAKRAGALPTPSGQQHACLVADFSDTASVQKTITDAVAGGARFNILVNNTGGPPEGRAIDCSADDYLKGFHAHFTCSHILVQALAPGMKQLGYGRIINITSTSAKAPIPNLGVSNAIRGAIANWAKSLSLDLGPDNITVNNVLPGFTETARLSSLVEEWSGKAGTTPELWSDAKKQTIPLRRFGTPEEIAAAVAFLASPAASYISGINLPVDGGRLPTL
jgi:3-oxoacyl-[acyl-carrier protein] reductase